MVATLPICTFELTSLHFGRLNMHIQNSNKQSDPSKSKSHSQARVYCVSVETFTASMDLIKEATIKYKLI